MNTVSIDGQPNPTDLVIKFGKIVNQQIRVQQIAFSILFRSAGWQVITSVVLTIPSAIGIYFLLMEQLHILKLERILCALMLALQITELAYAVLFIFTTCRPQTYT